MPVAPNPLLQSSTLSKPSNAASSRLDKPLQATGGQGGGFDQVMANQGRDKPSLRDDKVKPKDKPDTDQGGKAAAADKPAVADDGNKLPASDQAQASTDTDASSVDANLVAGQVTDAQPGAQLLQAQAQTVAPVLQAAAQQPPAPALPEEDAGETFDPEADALANMPTLRLALEQSAQAKGTTSAHAASNTAQQPQAEDGPVAVNPLANLVDKVEAEAGHAESGDKAFGALLEDGLKDTKNASSDTRIDDFANRLASLTQAATAKTANAVPVTPSPLHQPLAMNQNAWAEGLVNRVMYLSSQNLKSADIQLEPAELGRLDIRVNLAADQSTQVTFISGHAGVRDALDSQVHRLRELFAQQGLAQPDVNVADQSRGQQQQQAQQDGSQLSGVAARRAQEGGGGERGGDVADAARPVEQQVVIGDSAVDFYA
ncbi:flagellar hook-length control protein FliK [Pseudomonas faucium]|uniref:flagellar hook-length control protein FliK n=1 Tax=Pseudomonas faucium TaxID=2740518 RepID=UPI001F1BA3CA|nr:flagellar hook-length control protein FliK [Pseudomonas faucium]